MSSTSRTARPRPAAAAAKPATGSAAKHVAASTAAAAAAATAAPAIHGPIVLRLTDELRARFETIALGLYEQGRESLMLKLRLDEKPGEYHALQIDTLGFKLASVPPNPPLSGTRLVMGPAGTAVAAGYTSLGKVAHDWEVLSKFRYKFTPPRNVAPPAPAPVPAPAPARSSPPSPPATSDPDLPAPPKKRKLRSSVVDDDDDDDDTPMVAPSALERDQPVRRASANGSAALPPPAKRSKKAAPQLSDSDSSSSVPPLPPSAPPKTTRRTLAGSAKPAVTSPPEKPAPSRASTSPRAPAPAPGSLADLQVQFETKYAKYTALHKQLSSSADRVDTFRALKDRLARETPGTPGEAAVLAEIQAKVIQLNGWEVRDWVAEFQSLHAELAQLRRTIVQQYHATGGAAGAGGQ
ncbi:hypothetical protein H9P43_009905 [Blastocladiella emersonii ATCC 22665]|nr:hypothetical protein H9P43_009905 [Blastocladiella emersonii ATCC 22665]